MTADAIDRSAEQLHHAAELGARARTSGLRSVPCHDKGLMAMLEGRAVGQTPAGEAPSIALLDAWHKGWSKSAPAREASAQIERAADLGTIAGVEGRPCRPEIEPEILAMMSPREAWLRTPAGEASWQSIMGAYIDAWQNATGAKAAALS